MRSITIIFALILFSSLSLKANEYIYPHANCQITILPHENSSLVELAFDLLKGKSFKANKNPEKLPRLFKGDLYLVIDETRPKKKLWKDCIVHIYIRESRGGRPSSADKTLYDKEVKRSLPRVTFGGSERCTRALKDAFVHIPYCKKVGL